MNQCEMYANDGVTCADDLSKLNDEIKRLEISEAIHDIDSKLIDLEIALRISESKE